jgi:hypothetical protein
LNNLQLAQVNIMTLEEQLFKIEQEFWYGGKDEFLKNLDDRCLLAFPQSGEMHGIFPRDQIAATATAPNRWRDLTMTNRHVLNISNSAAMISYRADVVRADGQPYSALIASTYVQRGENWKLAAHQHSPIEQSKAAQKKSA